MFRADFAARVARLFRERQLDDYEFDVSVTDRDAEKDLAVTTGIVAAIEGLLWGDRGGPQA